MTNKTKLTEGLVERLTSDGRAERLYLDDKQPNLYLRVLRSGSKSWQVRGRIDGRTHVETIGRHPAMSLGQARLNAPGVLRKALHPNAIGREKLSVAEAADQWYRDRVENRYKRPEQTKAYLDRDLKLIAGKPIARVTRADVARLVSEKPPAAGNRLLAIVKQLFRHAATMEWIEADPLSVLTRRNVGSEEKPRDRVLTDDEIRRAWAIPAPHGTLYRFLLASGQRLSEALALGLDPSQVRAGIRYIDDNKADRPHRVPVLPLMQELLAEGLPDKKRAAAWAYWRKYMAGDATVHDIRRTVATKMREAGVSVDVIEALLNHAPPRLVRTYQRPDMTPQIAEALKVWHAALTEIVSA